MRSFQEIAYTLCYYELCYKNDKCNVCKQIEKALNNAHDEGIKVGKLLKEAERKLG